MSKRQIPRWDWIIQIILLALCIAFYWFAMIPRVRT